MSKAILIMDMPINCLECPFRYKSEEMPLGNFMYQSLFRCKNEPEDISEDDGDIVYLNDVMMKGKPNWCPLREVPERKDETWDIMNMEDCYYNDGWNDCINEILKEGAE